MGGGKGSFEWLTKCNAYWCLKLVALDSSTRRFFDIPALVRNAQDLVRWLAEARLLRTPVSVACYDIPALVRNAQD